MLKRLIGLGLVAVLGGVVSVVLHADTINAADCEEASVQTAVDASSAGDTVAIPAGTCTWSTTVTVDKAIEIVGAGGRGTKTQCEVGSQSTYTCIKGDIRHLTWTTPSTGNPRLAGITFYGDSNTNCDAYGSGHVWIGGTNPQMRIHDIVIDAGLDELCGYTGLIIAGYVRGVGWDSDFVQRSVVDHGTVVVHDRWADDTEAHGDQSWSEPSTLGTADAWYWEDVNYDVSGLSNIGFCTDDFKGSRVVYRFSTLTNCSLQNHGTETGARFRSHREVDYYRLNVSNSLEALAGALAFRGGSGQAWQNVFTSSGSGSFTQVIAGSTFRRDDTSHSDGWQPWNRCGTYSVTITRSGDTATVTEEDHEVHSTGSYVTISGADQAEYNGTFWAFSATADTYTFEVSGTPDSPATGTITAKSPFDGNADATGYRCLDQFGAGEGDDISGDVPPFGNVTPLTGINQTIQPVYIWGNTLNGSPTSLDSAGLPDVVDDNRDLFNENSSYNGTTQRGIFVGTSLPSNCTTGDAAWITSEGSWNTETTAMHANHGSNHAEGADGKRYECTDTDEWTADYGVSTSGEPYAYPHPLRAEAAAEAPRSRLRFRSADLWLPLSVAVVVFLRRRP